MDTPPTTAVPVAAAVPSPLARAALFAYVFLIVYASWYPFSGWQNLGLSPLAYLNTTPPRYWTMFDVATNIVGYVPLGILLVFSFYPRLRGTAAFAATFVICIMLSGTMEAVQTYLPSRVPSNLDFVTNTAGGALGAIIGMRATGIFLDQGRLYQLRQHWFSSKASRGLIVLALWPLAQIYPQSSLFGHGQLMPVLSEWFSTLLATPIDLAAWLMRDVDLSVEQYWLSETIVTACGLVGAVLMMLYLLRAEAPKWRLGMFLIVAAIIVKTLASALLFTPENALVWITPGAEGGLLIGSMMLAGLTFAPAIAQRRIAVAALLIGLVIVNTVPTNPYFVETLQNWLQGKFLNFNGAAECLSILWPFLALTFLLSPER